jgi:biopolymer transport protein ExbD
MAYKTPTSRRTKKKEQGLNLIPILDAVFIFIFFLLFSVQFINVREIGSDVPMVSDAPPPKNQKKPLALTLTINKNSLNLAKGVPSSDFKTIPKEGNDYNYEQLHSVLVELKKQYPYEKDIIFMPLHDVDYEVIIKIMDSVRMLRPTDEKIYLKDKDGVEQLQTLLFNKIAFGNLMD